MKKTKMKKFLAILLCIVNVLGQITPVSAQDTITGVTNIALGSTVTASEEYSTMPAS